MGKRADKKRHRNANNASKPTKQPTIGAAPNPLKRPAPTPIETNGACLVFGLQFLDSHSPWALHHADANHIALIAEKCKSFESMTPEEVFATHTGNKFCGFDSFCQEAYDRLHKLELDDYGGLWELRLGGTQRLWGLRSGHIFYVVWWDPEHLVCPSVLRNT